MAKVTKGTVLRNADKGVPTVVVVVPETVGAAKLLNEHIERFTLRAKGKEGRYRVLQPSRTLIEKVRRKGTSHTYSSRALEAALAASTEEQEILSRVEQWAGSADAARKWYRSTPIPSLGDQTAEGLVESGQATLVRSYLNRIAIGGYA